MFNILSKLFKFVTTGLIFSTLMSKYNTNLNSRIGRLAPAKDTKPGYSLLVVCEELVPCGGLLRFERMGRILVEQGHQLCFMPFTQRIHTSFKSSLPVLSRKESAMRQWDAVMIPGAGFSDEIIEEFKTLCNPNYGVRVQHILSDQTRKAGFINVNQSFQPDVVIFNNPEWSSGEYPELLAKRFHYLFGAVDPRKFYPKSFYKRFGTRKNWVIGGQASKNAHPLIKALEILPNTYSVKLFGSTRNLEKQYAQLVRAGRLQFVGILAEEDLLSYYHSVNYIVHTEKFAGWANLVAEAMACGLPVICTRHGTKVFAIHNQNSIVLDTPSPENIAKAVLELSECPIHFKRLAKEGRQAVMDLTWNQYAEQMLNIIFNSTDVNTANRHHPHRIQ